ncbi:hypothetical protein D3C84_910850 [compost metagenome]
MAWAMHSALYPVKVPTSITRCAPIRRTSSASNWPCSGATCQRASGKAWVSMRKRASNGVSRRETACRYW